MDESKTEENTQAPAGGVRLRRALEAVAAYKAGKPAAQREDLVTYKISSNENPYPPLPSVIQAVAEAAATMNRYPDAAVTELTDELAKHCGVTPAEVVTGTGSVGVLGYLVQATCDAGDEMLYAWRSFEAYPIIAAVNDVTSVQVPLTKDARHDLDAMAAAVTDRTRLIIVCTPNNPTGPSVHEDELRAFLAKVPSDVLVVIDEAYLEFATSVDTPDALAIYREFANVCVLRTFSKAYGLAGLRVGYVIAHEPVAEALRKVSLPFGVSDLAQKAAVASLAAHSELQERVDALIAERTRVIEALRGQGWPVPDSEANFIWMPLGDDTMAFAAAAEEAGLVVRPFAGEGARCTIAETAANDRLIEVARAFRNR